MPVEQSQYFVTNGSSSSRARDDISIATHVAASFIPSLAWLHKGFGSEQKADESCSYFLDFEVIFDVGVQ